MRSVLSLRTPRINRSPPLTGLAATAALESRSFTTAFPSVPTRVSQLASRLQVEPAELAAFSLAFSDPTRFRSGRELLDQGTSAPGVWLILSGFAYRYVSHANGRRQIVGYLVPGDLCGLDTCSGTPMDHSVAAVDSVIAALLPSERLLSLTEKHPELLRSLWRRAAIDAAVTRQWLINVGQRDSFARLAHLFCELYTRMQYAGLCYMNSCEMPIAQTSIADALALSAVHVNRTVMRLRRAGMVSLGRRRLNILDAKALRAAAGFDPAYLGNADEGS
jgi:CRP-like cAMP-binding protein